MRSPRRTGVVSVEDLARAGLMPSPSRLAEGPVAIIECIEEIPCDVCVWSCPFEAVTKAGLTSLPKMDFAKCIGCARCVAKCPGQAIFVVDSRRGLVYLPYEMYPPPRAGEHVKLLDREGREVGVGRVARMFEDNKTLVVAVEAPREAIMEVRAIRVGGR